MNAKSGNSRLVRVLIAGAVYFGLVFGAGFLLGPIRILLLVPRFGERAAELIEMPFMLLVILLAARFVIRTFSIPAGVPNRLRMGLLALVLGLLFECGLVLKLRGLTLTEYFRTRDPITGTAYYLVLGLFAVMPLIVKRKLQPDTNERKIE